MTRKRGKVVDMPSATNRKDLDPLVVIGALVQQYHDGAVVFQATPCYSEAFRIAPDEALEAFGRLRDEVEGGR